MQQQLALLLPGSSPGSVGLARAHPLTKTQAMKPSRHTWSSYGAPYPLGRWSSGRTARQYETTLRAKTILPCNNHQLQKSLEGVVLHLIPDGSLLATTATPLSNNNMQRAVCVALPPLLTGASSFQDYLFLYAQRAILHCPAVLCLLRILLEVRMLHVPSSFQSRFFSPFSTSVELFCLLYRHRFPKGV